MLKYPETHEYTLNCRSISPFSAKYRGQGRNRVKMAKSSPKMLRNIVENGGMSRKNSVELVAGKNYSNIYYILSSLVY